MKNTVQIFIRTYTKIQEGKLALLCTNNVPKTLYVVNFSYYSTTLKHDLTLLY